jgi:hypothetical protein
MNREIVTIWTCPRCGYPADRFDIILLSLEKGVEFHFRAPEVEIPEELL